MVQFQLTKVTCCDIRCSCGEGDTRRGVACRITTRKTPANIPAALVYTLVYKAPSS